MPLMRFAIAIPQFYADGEFEPAQFRAYMGRAEELGYESAWTQEQVLGTWPQLSPLEAMTYAAACTSRLRLGCVVFVTPLHSPVHLAKNLSTLDQLSRGRLDVGVGTGGGGGRAGREVGRRSGIPAGPAPGRAPHVRWPGGGAGRIAAGRWGGVA